jgi:hypothetical protein
MYTQQGRAHIRRLHTDWAARPALMRRAAHAVESKAVVRIEVADWRSINLVVGSPGLALPGSRAAARGDQTTCCAWLAQQLPTGP